ncbi:hypothetical protein NE237_021333 [Protea cynaroides]|uniref:Protein kinase domain-containing protein n=1 Tax=Protea cynaroides TaxID=273540 RepID=A0A9Q0H8B7_9MAGN|nr:hypothetical protein NE237_021333 [Protea cynaroides]
MTTHSPTETYLDIVIELCDSSDLNDRVTKRTFSDIEAAAITLPLMEAIAHCHRRGVAHHDINPDNILFVSRNGLKLADFGSAELEIAAIASLFLLFSAAGFLVNFMDSILLPLSLISLIALFTFGQEFLFFLSSKERPIWNRESLLQSSAPPYWSLLSLHPSRIGSP